MKIKFTVSALNQFLKGLESIRRDNPYAAKGFRKKAETVLRKLETYLASGRAIPEFPDLPYREVIVSPYRFFYRSEGETVWGVAVWHGAQLPNEPSRNGTTAPS